MSSSQWKTYDTATKVKRRDDSNFDTKAHLLFKMAEPLVLVSTNYWTTIIHFNSISCWTFILNACLFTIMKKMLPSLENIVLNMRVFLLNI